LSCNIISYYKTEFAKPQFPYTDNKTNGMNFFSI